MPVLATIDPPNVRKAASDMKQAEVKKKPKASSLCYTPPAMINDKKRDRSYFRRGLLGEGGFARCFEVSDFHGTRLAAKCIAKGSITSEKVKMKLLGEIKVHKSMDHPNIVRQRDCFEDDVNVYMILDICTNGTLMDMLRSRKRFTEPEVRYFGLQILGAAKYMHSRRVIHRDLKLANLFLDENMCIKVGDFGLAALLVDDNDRKKTICGTPNYIAPEVLFSSPEGHSYEVDLWSIGVIFYAMLIGKPPFQSKDVKVIYAKIKTNEYEFPSGSIVSEDARSLITSLLCTDPENRPCLDDIASHTFFTSGVMPRSIPTSATKQEPHWPASQSHSIFMRNLSFVSMNAGIGPDQSAGNEPGQKVDVAVEHPEVGHYLPVSLSPRTGPAPKIINLTDERSGGRGSTLSDRLHSVKIQGGPDRGRRSPARDTLAESQARDLRRATLGAGAVRSTASTRMPVSDAFPSQHVPAPVDRHEKVKVGGPAAKIIATRVANETVRPLTRSSRFTQIAPIPDEGVLTTAGLSARPVRRTVSSSAARVSQTDTRSTHQPLTTTRASSRLGTANPQDFAENVYGDMPTQRDELVSRPVSRVATSAAMKAMSTNLKGHRAFSSKSDTAISGTRSPMPQDTFRSIESMASWISDVLTGVRVPFICELDESPIVHVSKWVDYSHRYGLGYQLSSESTGVYFNDATTIIHEARSTHFNYISASLERMNHSLECPPKTLEKKIYLLKHFRGYMNVHLDSSSSGSRREEEYLKEAAPCYMTHYWRTKAGILFRLSDGTLQLNFTDHSKLMIPMPDDLNQMRLRYVDTEKTANVWSLSSASQNTECREKIECMVKVLYSFVETES